MKRPRNRWKIIFIGFLLMMLVMDMVSRVIAQIRTPVVDTCVMVGRTLSHDIQKSGVLQAVEQSAVWLMPGLRIDCVYAVEGQTLAAGDVILKLNEEDICRSLTEADSRYEFLVMEVEGMEKETARNLSRAQEDYDAVLGSFEVKLANLQQEYENAEKVLTDYEKYLSGNSVENDEAYLYFVKQQLANLRKQQSALNENRSLLLAQRDYMDILAEEKAEIENSDAVEDRETKERTERAKADFQIAGYLCDTGIQIAEMDYSLTEMDIQSTLSEQVEANRRAYDETYQQMQEELIRAGRQLEDAKERISCQYEILSRKQEMEALSENIVRLKKLQSSQGKITADRDCFIQKMFLSSGGATGEDAAFILSDVSKGFRVEFTASREELRYISVGESFCIRSGNRVDSSAAVIAIIPDGTEGQIVIQTEEIGFHAGENVKLTAQLGSEPYETTIPLEAVFTDQMGRSYLYYVREEETILGTKPVVRKAGVELLDKNGQYAAISGNIKADTRIIVETDKELREGMTVRVR